VGASNFDFLSQTAGAESRSRVERLLTGHAISPALFVFVAEEVFPPAAIAVALAVVAILASERATALTRIRLQVLARERVGVTFQALSANIGIVAAVVASEAPCLGAHILAEGGASHGTHTQNGQCAPSRRLDHPAATGLVSNIAGEIVKH
jgi:hypothetical protein